VRWAKNLSKTALLLLAHYADPHQVIRLGRARLTRFLYRHSLGAWGQAKAEELLAVAAETLELWGEELDYPDLAEDIAIEARWPWRSPRSFMSSMSASARCSQAVDDAGVGVQACSPLPDDK
jgi:hypothetical protein